MPPCSLCDEASCICHYMSVAQLRKALAQLPDHFMLVPNAVRNLAIMEGREYKGFIDFLNGRSDEDLVSMHSERRP